MEDIEIQNKQLLETFYQAFLNFDGEAMASCYHPDAHFSDAVFPDLNGEMPGNMWRMLCHKLQSSPSKLRYTNVWANETEGGCDWEAEYIFSATGKKVHNIISSRFKFADGKIIDQQDSFNFWRWSRMALGMPGYLLGWSGFLRGKVQLQANQGLQQFVASTTTTTSTTKD
jgi:ketosteroid isomerase-like protein